MAEVKQCIGYPGCDGMLPGEDETCPLRGTFGPPRKVESLLYDATNPKKSTKSGQCVCHLGSPCKLHGMAEVKDKSAELMIKNGEIHEKSRYCDSDCVPYITERGRLAGLEEAARAAENEKVNYEDTHDDTDAAYNLACDHCAAAIRSLAQQGREE